MQLRTQRTRRALCIGIFALFGVGCGDDDGTPSGGRDGGAGSGMPAMDAGGAGSSGGLGANVAGQACDDNADCGSGRCAMQVAGLSLDGASLMAPAGYCTATCMTSAECGEGGVCITDLAGSACYAGCTTNDECREDYRCEGLTVMGAVIVPNSCRPNPPNDQLEDGVVGDECAAAEDCRGGRCSTMSPGFIAGLGATPLPGGYCSGACLEAAHCGEGGVCVAALTGGAGTCYLGCSADDDCDRDGYRCRQVAMGIRACSPFADPLPDDSAGDACSSDDDCGGAMGTCVTQLPGPGPAGQFNPVVAPGGYCSAACVEPSDCGQGGVCSGVLTGGCLQACTDINDCRDGYLCEPRNVFGTIPMQAVDGGAAPGTNVCVPGMTTPPEEDAGL